MMWEPSSSRCQWNMTRKKASSNRKSSNEPVCNCQMILYRSEWKYLAWKIYNKPFFVIYKAWNKRKSTFANVFVLFLLVHGPFGSASVFAESLMAQKCDWSRSAFSHIWFGPRQVFVLGGPFIIGFCLQGKWSELETLWLFYPSDDVGWLKVRQHECMIGMLPPQSSFFSLHVSRVGTSPGQDIG